MDIFGPMPKDHSRDNEWVDVMGGPFPNGKKMKRFQAENPVTKEMGIHIVGERQLKDIEPARRGRKSNAEKENEVLLQRIADLEGKLSATKTEDAAEA